MKHQISIQSTQNGLWTFLVEKGDFFARDILEERLASFGIFNWLSEKIKPLEFNKVRLTIVNQKAALEISQAPLGEESIPVRTLDYKREYENSWQKQSHRDLEQEGYEVFKYHNNIVSEGLISNIFILRNNQIITPRLGKDLYAGMARQWLLNNQSKIGIKILEDHIKKEWLYDSQAIFCTNALRGLRIVSEIDGTKCKQDASVLELKIKLEENYRWPQIRK